MQSKSKLIIIFIATIISVALIGGTIFYVSMPSKPSTQTGTTQSPVATDTPSGEVMPDNYSGETVTVGDGFKVNVPNGWRASVSTNTSFLAIMFARPGAINSLAYDASKAPEVDFDGVPTWGGLTEHFYIRSMTVPSQNFNPKIHTEVATERFVFDNGTIGKKYLVTKHAEEAAQWGGLRKDDAWYGRVYVYEAGNKRIEAHLAYYPSTGIQETFFENVAKSIRL